MPGHTFLSDSIGLLVSKSSLTLANALKGTLVNQAFPPEIMLTVSLKTKQSLIIVTSNTAL